MNADWRAGFEGLEDEHDAAPCVVVGALPAELRGTLYRNGPARHTAYGDRYRSWFCGDGMVHAVRITDDGVTATNRFVATRWKAEEDRSKERIYASYATPTAGGPLRRFSLRDDPKNPANTSVWMHAGRLWALCEGGRPHRLDPLTLETLGEDNLGGVLGPDRLYSAHPRRCPQTGALWNFGVAYGAHPAVFLYETTAQGQTRQRARAPLPWMALVHDFLLTPNWAVFVVPPLSLPRIPVAVILGQRSFGGSLRWRPERGTRILAVHRETGEVRESQGPPVLVFHGVEAWEEGDDLVFDLCAYPDDELLRFIERVMQGDHTLKRRPRVERWRMGREGEVTASEVTAAPLELPRTLGLAGPDATVWGLGWSDAHGFLAVPTAVARGTGAVTQAPLAAHDFAGEPVPVAKADGSPEPWLLTVVLDAHRRRSRVDILDAADLTAPPVATIHLPYAMPFGFHGGWAADRPQPDGKAAEA